MPSEYPGMVPAKRETFTVSITMGDTMRTPGDVIRAVERSLTQYGRERKGTTTPFAQQPGFPSGDIKDRDDVIVGTWKIEGGV